MLFFFVDLPYREAQNATDIETSKIITTIMMTSIETQEDPNTGRTTNIGRTTLELNPTVITSLNKVRLIPIKEDPHSRQ